MSPAKKPTQPIDVYVRVSRVGGRGGDSYQSPEEQEERCRGFLQAHGYEAGVVFKDEDQTGRKMKRPEFDKALARIHAGASGGLVVARLNRFGRTAIGAIQTIQEIEDAGAAFLSIDPPVDTSTGNGRFMLLIFAGLAELESDTIQANWASVQANARRRGVHISARVPFGYVKNGNGTLAQDENAPLVEQVFRRRAAGEAWDSICAWLNAEGARTPLLGDGSGETGGGNPWLEGALRKLVQNPIYKGEPRGGDDLPEEHRKALRVVSPRVWDRAQPKDGGRRPRSPEGALLAGLVRCGECGGWMTPEITTKPSGTKIQAYRCRQRATHKAGTCPKPMTVSGNLLEPYVIEQAVAHWNAHPPQYELVDEGQLAGLREAVEDARFERDEFERTALEQGLKPAAVAGMLAQYAARVDEAQAVLDAEEDKATGTVTLGAGSGSGTLEMTLPEMRAALKNIIASVTVKRGPGEIAERAEIEWAR